MIAGNNVLITDGSGNVIDIVVEAAAGDAIETFNGILSPGFINCHCHLELSHMKGLIPKHTGLVDFVFKIVTERHFEEEQILAAIEAAENEMIQNGIVAVGDICNNPMTIPQKLKGKLYYHNFIEASAVLPSIAADRFQRSVDLYAEYAKQLPAGSIVPHAPYSVSQELFNMINTFPNNQLLTIHNQEIFAENELFENGTGDFLRMYDKMAIDITAFKPSGKTSLQTYLPYFTKGQSIILVHNVATSAKDIEFTNDFKPQTSNLKPQTWFCLCPNANRYISNKLPDISLFLANSGQIVLGTDSLASNDQLSILEEMKTIKNHFPSLTVGSILQWATMNGARALEIGQNYGSFEKGKKPGIVLIDNDFSVARPLM
ncbi:amidohydrolase family protein [soil metagenome]